MEYILVKKYGFTLAEVLITLTIVGVIAAIMIPDVIYKSQVNKNITLLKKTYASLQQVTNRVIAENGETPGWGMVDNSIDSITSTYLMYKPFFKVMRQCANSQGCWAYPTRHLNGQTYWAAHQTSWYQYAFTTMDGVNILMDIYPASSIHSDFGVDTNMDGVVFWVDMNAEHLPNTIGVDIFAFVVTKKGLIPAGQDRVSDCSENGRGWTCTAKIIQDSWKITYKIPK